MTSGVSSPCRGTSPEPRPLTRPCAELHLDHGVRLLQDEDLLVALPDLLDERLVERIGEADLVEVDPPLRPQGLEELGGVGEGNAGGDDAGPRPGAVAGRRGRGEGRFLGDPVELFVQEAVEFGEELRRGHPPAGVLFKIRLLLPGLRRCGRRRSAGRGRRGSSAGA